LKYLLRNVLDSKTTQTAQQIRSRNYDDEIQCYDHQPPEDAPGWVYTEQPNDIYDTDFNRYMREDEDAEDFDERSSSKSNSIIEAEN
ncbi:2344_t:CDS:1, partial [Funneliformis caledonium]